MYSCKDCSWKGSKTEIEYDRVDTCFGYDEIECCPECGSYNVKLYIDNKKGHTK